MASMWSLTDLLQDKGQKKEDKNQQFPDKTIEYKELVA